MPCVTRAFYFLTTKAVFAICDPPGPATLCASGAMGRAEAGLGEQAQRCERQQHGQMERPRISPVPRSLRTKSPEPELASTFCRWKDDKSVPECEGCEAKFTLLTRRHHCRLCGRIFCASCCRDKRPIPKFDYMQPVRMCKHCSQLCWKSEALLLAIRTNDIETVTR